MNITRRRGAIALAITLGVLIVGGLIAFNIAWIILNERRIALLVVGLILFGLITTGVVLNTVFLVREVRRNERRTPSSTPSPTSSRPPSPPSASTSKPSSATTSPNPSATSSTPSCWPTPTVSSPPSSRSSRPANSAPAAPRTASSSNSPRWSPTASPSPFCATTSPPKPSSSHPSPATSACTSAPSPRTSAPPSSTSSTTPSSTPPNGVDVRCSLAIAGYTDVALTVADRGVGIAPDQLKRIFKRFYRVPGRNAARIHGTGLGLFLVRAIARQHGGSIAAASPGTNLGATITLTLPLANPGAHQPAQ